VSRTASTAAIADLIEPLPSGAVVIAVSDEGVHPRFAPVRQLAALAALHVGGTALFCVDPTHDTSMPRPRPRLYLPPVDRPGLGRQHTGTRSHDLLLEEAREVAAPGLTVAVWLPSRHGPAGVAEAVAATNGAIVLVPARLARHGVLDRTLDYLAARVPAPVVAVSLDGQWTPVSALGGAADGAWPRLALRPALLAATAV
jgi:hypothetical protein